MRTLTWPCSSSCRHGDISDKHFNSNLFRSDIDSSSVSRTLIFVRKLGWLLPFTFSRFIFQIILYFRIDNSMPGRYLEVNFILLRPLSSCLLGSWTLIPNYSSLILIYSPIHFFFVWRYSTYTFRPVSNCKNTYLINRHCQKLTK